MDNRVNLFMKNRKMSIVLVITLLIITLFTTQVMAYPSTYALSVSLQKQQKSKWCWAAVASSILAYKWESVSQTKFVTTVKGSDIDAGATISEVQSGLSAYGVSSTKTSTIAFSTIINEIYTYDRPIFVAWDWNGLTYGHAQELVGYDDGTTDYVEYMDPAYGDLRVSTYTYFKGGSSYPHVWTGTLYQLR